jgi:hypothetical protein
MPESIRKDQCRQHFHSLLLAGATSAALADADYFEPFRTHVRNAQELSKSPSTHVNWPRKTQKTQFAFRQQHPNSHQQDTCTHSAGAQLEKKRDQKSKNPCRFPCRGFAKVAVKKRFEPVSIASQSVPNPLITRLALSSPARFVAIWLYDFDTFSTPPAKPAL